MSQTGNATWRIHANSTLRFDVCFRSEISKSLVSLPVKYYWSIRGNATWLIFTILRFDVSQTGNATWRIHANSTLRFDVCFRSDFCSSLA